ncbi:MAG: N-acetylmuramoyl-L-alanine amidase-like domain-containing protein [Bacteroidota bacterium]
MIRYVCFLCLSVVLGKLSAQVSATPKDRALFHAKMTSIAKQHKQAGPQSITDIAKTFQGTPYVAGSLEVGEKETLVVNLRGFDCTTYVENVLAFYHLYCNDLQGYTDFEKALGEIRYRHGKVAGYASRLHYFTDWIYHNAKKGLLKDITATLGGEVLPKTLNFMGTHRNLYPALTDANNYKQITAIEESLAQRELCVIPQEAIPQIEDRLKSGDIIALATSIEGLDVTHTGFAIRLNNGRIHLLHASTSGTVTITEAPLETYLKTIKHNIGIVVARPL